MIWIKRQTINPEVTDYYLNTIGDAYVSCGSEIKYFSNWKEYNPQSNDITVVTRYKEVLKMILEGRKYIYWVQGLLPEENYAQKKSVLRKRIYECIEKIMIRETGKKGRYFVMVSKYMQRHFETKYNLTISNCYVMPCNNDVIHEESFESANKYERDIFCYAGGLSVWQCFDRTLDIYKRIEQLKPDTKLLLLVPDKVRVERMVSERGIKNYEIDYVAVDQLPHRLKEVKYGFILREDLELNRVATPTKLMTYIGNGVIPIMSKCLFGLFENMDESEYVIKMDSIDDVSEILSFMAKRIDKQSIMENYRNLYQLHYDRDNHVKALATCLPKDE